MFLNYVATKYHGKPLYHFMTWEDYTTFVIAALITIGSLLVYFGIAIFSEKSRKYKESNTPKANKQL